MSYIVLARKWRPMQFEEVVGQEHVTRTLMNALKQERIAHSFIFAGPRGVGKTTTARLLAKAVNCEKQPALNPCNECSSCKNITAGTGLDMIEIDGASNRGIDEIRNLRENIRFAPAYSKYKIYIIDEVHMLTKEAFNALLKTLEEPPSHAIFIFATTEIHRVPLTILSRCQRFDFKRIPSAEIADMLEKISQSEKFEIDKDSLLLIARKSEGSMRDAESILDQMVSFTDGKITIEAVQSSLGLISEEMYFEFSDLMLEKDDAKIIEFAQKVFKSGHDLLDFIYGLQEHFRNLLVTKSTGSTRLLETSDYFKEQYQQNSEKFAENDLLQYFELLAESEQIIKFSPNPQLILELLLLKLCHKPFSVDLEELMALLNNSPGSIPETPATSQTSFLSSGSSIASTTKKPSYKKKVEQPTLVDKSQSVREEIKDPFERLKGNPFPQKPSPYEKTSPVTNKQAAQISLDDLKEKWPEIVESIKNQKIALGSFLSDGEPYNIKDNSLEIAFDTKTQFHLEHIKKNSVIIEKILAEQFQIPLKIHFISLDFEKEGIDKKVHSPEEIIEDIKNKGPVLKKIIETFDCYEIDDS
jgi:DNA polymerase-3 subunit gamma/tau